MNLRMLLSTMLVVMRLLFKHSPINHSLFSFLFFVEVLMFFWASNINFEIIFSPSVFLGFKY